MPHEFGFVLHLCEMSQECESKSAIRTGWMIQRKIRSIERNTYFVCNPKVYSVAKVRIFPEDARGRLQLCTARSRNTPAMLGVMNSLRLEAYHIFAMACPTATGRLTSTPQPQVHARVCGRARRSEPSAPDVVMDCESCL